jgi:tetratricopeptide (TPR) repeat protein
MAVAQTDDEHSGSAATPEAEAGSSAASRLAAKRAAKAAAKAKKRGTSTVPNPVAEGVTKVRSVYERSSRTLWSIVGAAVVVGGVFVGAQTYLESQAKAAAQLLVTGLTTAHAPIVAAEAEPSEDDPDESYPTAQARAEKSKGAFATVSKRYAESTAALWARLGEATALYELGKHADAQRLFSALTEQRKLDPYLQIRALEGLGFALEAQGKYGDAAKRFEQLAKADGGSHKALGDFHRARMLIAQGKKQAGAELLQTLVKAERARPATEGGVSFEGLVSDAEMLLNELAVELGAPQLRVDLPASQRAMPASGAGTGLTQDIVDALRKQLESGSGSKGLTKDIVEQLERQVQDRPPSPHPSPQPGPPE